MAIQRRRNRDGDSLRPTGNTPRRAAAAKSVHPRGRKFPGGKPQRRMERAKRERFTRALEEENASNAEQRRAQRKRRTTGAEKRQRRRARYLATLGERLVVNATAAATPNHVEISGEVTP